MISPIALESPKIKANKGKALLPNQAALSIAASGEANSIARKILMICLLIFSEGASKSLNLAAISSHEKVQGKKVKAKRWKKILKVSWFRNPVATLSKIAAISPITSPH